MVRPELLTLADLPASFGRHELLSILGEGGMARVFRARMVGPSGFRKQIALKVIHRVVADQGDSLRLALTHEARLGGMLHHPNVVDTYDFGEEEGQPWIALELVDGLTLDDLLARVGRVPPSLAVEIGLQICAGLEHAHTLEDEGRPAGLVHRDLKPSNVIVSRQGLAKVMDFGIAKAAHLSGNTTATGMTKGTPAFMSPEQMAAEELDHRSDLFALGSVLYELVTGRRLFDADTVMAVMMSIFRVDDTLQASRKLEVLDEVHPGLRVAIEGCLQKEPDDRPAGAREVITALRRVATGFERGLRLDEYVEAALADRAPRLEPLVSGEGPALAPPSTPRRAQKPAAELMAPPAPGPKEVASAEAAQETPPPVAPRAAVVERDPPRSEVGPTVLVPARGPTPRRSLWPILALLGGGLLLAVGLLVAALLLRGEPETAAPVGGAETIPDLPVEAPPLATATPSPRAKARQPAGPGPARTREEPTQTSPIVLLEAPARAPVGRSARFAVRLQGFNPETVALRFRPQGGAWQSRQMRLDAGIWSTTLDIRAGMEGSGDYWFLARDASGARRKLGSRDAPLQLEVVDASGEPVPSTASAPASPAAPAELSLSTERKVRQARVGETRTWMVRLTGDGEVSVSLRFRPEGGVWQSRAMERGPAGRWSVDVVVPQRWAGQGSYYFYARAEDGRTALLGSREQPFSVDIR